MATSRRFILVGVAGLLFAALGCSPADEGGRPDGWPGGDGAEAGEADGVSEGASDDGEGTGYEFTPPDVGDLGAEVCDQAPLDIARVIPDMLIVLDRSNSMLDEGYWNPVREAIYAVTEAMDLQIWFGLMIFPNFGEGLVCRPAMRLNECEPGHTAVVGCAADTAEAIRGTLEPMATCGGTPIAVTLQNAQAYLDTLAADGHPKYVLLATDGAPNCNAALDPAACRCTGTAGCDAAPLNCLDDTRTSAAIDGLVAAGTRMYVLGIGTSGWMDILDAMAARGGTGAAFFAEDPAALRAAFDTIAVAVATCDFDIPSPSASADPTLVNVYFDGEAVPGGADCAGGTSEGWAWTDDSHTRVVFCGSYCDAILAGSVAAIDATWGCPTIII
jgi:hypothetical protein